MFRIGSRPQPRALGPWGTVASVIGVLMLVVLALVTLGVALLFLPGRRSKARVTSAQAKAGLDPAPLDDATDGANEQIKPRRERSYAEVIEAWPFVALLGLSLTAGTALLGATSAAAKVLVPMDEHQTDHLKAYGLTYWVLTRGQKAEWLLNYRGGSFLLQNDPATEREANVRGVSTEPMDGAAEAAMRAEVADNNMEVVVLEKAPKVAVYMPPNTPPWDDAVTLALEYTSIHLLAVIAGNTAYAFALMVFCFLVGLAAGASVCRRLLAASVSPSQRASLPLRRAASRRSRP